MTLFLVLLALVIIAVVGYLYKDYFFGTIKQVTEGEKGEAEVEEVLPANIIGREKFALIPYKEALESSRQFIYNIAKVVAERFSSSAQSTVLEFGKKLVNAGVQYVHVVDVFTLSLQKQIGLERSALKKKEKKKDLQI